MEISIISDIFTVFLLALQRLERILPGFFATMLPHMVGKPRPSMIDATVKKNTVTIIQKDQYVFGGYTDIPWGKI